MTLYKTFGATEFDQDGADASSLFDSLDPSHANLIAWTRAVMNAELLRKGWRTAAHGTKLQSADPVENTLNREPEVQLMRQAKFAFPLLYVYPRESQSAQHTLELARVDTTWRFGYVLGTGTAPEYQSLAGVLRTFPKLVAAMFSARAHEAYDNGDPQLQEGKVDFSSVRLTRSVYGAASFGEQGDGVTFYMSELELITSEVEGDITDAYPTLSGFDVSGELSGLGDFVQGRVDL